MTEGKPTYPFHEFFAGSGLVRCGLSSRFDSVWANDISERKAAVYRSNFGEENFHLGDIADVSGEGLPAARLSWASFPCQDLSLAGNIEGIYSERSGLVWQWLRVIDELGDEAPKVVCLENVSGLVSAHGGQDYQHLHAALVERGYTVGSVLINADRFVPQSRPRVFVVGTRSLPPKNLLTEGPTWAHPKNLAALGRAIDGFVWWDLPEPPQRSKDLGDIVDHGAAFDREDVVPLISSAHLKKALESGREYVTGYRRTRHGRQVLELRCDGVAGCLRTPAGGSSRQFIIHFVGDEVEARLLTVREVARLMGAPESFELPGSYNDGYFAMGDAVAVPVARFLAENLLYALVEAAYGH